MADLTISGTVTPSSSALTETMTAGAAISAGEVVYKDSSDSDKAKLAQADGTEAEATVYGIAANSAASGQPVEVVRKDSALAIGATVAVGDFYVVSATAGGIAPNADLVTDDYFSVIGWTVSTSAIAVNFTYATSNTGAQHV